MLLSLALETVDTPTREEPRDTKVRGEELPLLFAETMSICMEFAVSQTPSQLIQSLQTILRVFLIYIWALRSLFNQGYSSVGMGTELKHKTRIFIV